ncbi:MAG: hypothetical protein AAGK02_08415 [Pseudomonadota bacterium]
MKPSDFMIGLINFLSILLPGAIATTLILYVSPDLKELTGRLPQQDVFTWVIGFAAAYFVGHLVFLAGSWLDPVYDYVRRIRDPYGGKIKKSKSRLHSIAVWLLRKRDFRLKPVAPKRANQPFVVVDRLRRKVMTLTEFKATNTFQWCRAILIQNSPAAHRDIEIHEADQKLFRSLVVLGFAVCVGAAIVQDWVLSGIALAAALASFMRYYNRRLKTVTLAYVHVLTMHRCGGLDFRAIEDQSPSV